jgi:di- and tripeptidase
LYFRYTLFIHFLSLALIESLPWLTVIPAMDTVDSGSTSEVEDQSKTWGSDARTLVPQGADDASSAHPHSDCGIGHRVLASRSVLALVIDEECVFAGLQGGDIVVS